MALSDGYARDTVDGTYTVTLPDEPGGVKPMLETQLDEALTHIKNIDAQIAEYRTKRTTYVEQAYAARAKLIEKCDSAKSLLDTTKRVPSENY